VEAGPAGRGGVRSPRWCPLGEEPLFSGPAPPVRMVAAYAQVIEHERGTAAVPFPRQRAAVYLFQALAL